MVYGYDPSKDSGSEWARKRYGSAATPQKTAIANAGPARGAKSFTKYDAARNAALSPEHVKQFPTSQQVDQHQGRTQETNEPSLMDILINEITQQYQRPAPGKPDFTSLDESLKGRLAGLQGIRDQAQTGFNTSDTNLAAMFGANKNDVETNSAARYNQIADQLKGNLQANNQQSIGTLQGIDSENAAKREALLRNIGQYNEGAGTPMEASAPIQEAIASIGNRQNSAMNMADQSRASNLAFNQTTANSIGQQGVERRAALAQQLQGIMGKLGMVEADYRDQDYQQRAQIQNGLNEDKLGYQIFADRQDNLTSVFNNLLRQQNGQQAPEQEKIGGYQSLAQDLVNNPNNSPEEVSATMAALSQVLASNPTAAMGGNLTNAIIQKLTQPPYNIDPVIAAQAATNYTNLPSLGSIPVSGG